MEIPIARKGIRILEGGRVILMENIMRQGDLLFRRIEQLPANLKRLQSNVIAEGETTGHKHRLVGQQVQVFEDAQAQKFIQLLEPAELVHEEHNTINLDIGNYVVVQEREFDPFSEAIRRVAD